jgi:nucleotidyltransferase/DNA polymerase involved in DNA repair
MSILCCHIPEFLFASAALAHPEWRKQPVALLGSDERVWAASQPARESGVHIGLTPRQAHARCPDAVIHSLNLQTSEDFQSAFLSVLAQTGLTVEVQDFGAAYVDLKPVVTSPADAAPVCADLGKQLRKALGAPLQPAVGCDHGKFTARAAAGVARPGRMRIVDRSDEPRFLAPLPVGMLPLPAQTQQHLHWLGVDTLAKFAALKATDVVQRFGQAGKLAHRWAKGEDERPVRSTLHAVPDVIDVDFDSPTASRDVALTEAMHALRPKLRALSQRLEGCRKLHITLAFLDGTKRQVTTTFVKALSEPAPMRAGIAQALNTYAWNAELTHMQLTLLDVAERYPKQLMLFDVTALFDAKAAAPAPFTALVETLSGRHTGAFFGAQLTDPRHAVRERRFIWLPLLAA